MSCSICGHEIIITVLVFMAEFLFFGSEDCHDQNSKTLIQGPHTCHGGIGEEYKGVVCTPTSATSVLCHFLEEL